MTNGTVYCFRSLTVLCSHHSGGALRRGPGRQRGGLHHLARLPPGVPASPELPLDHHGAGAVAAHRPQLQPALRDREAGLQVRQGRGHFIPSGFLSSGAANFNQKTWQNNPDLYVKILSLFIEISSSSFPSKPTKHFSTFQPQQVTNAERLNCRRRRFANH